MPIKYCTDQDDAYIYRGNALNYNEKIDNAILLYKIGIYVLVNKLTDEKKNLLFTFIM